MARGWKAMRPEGLEAKNNSSLQASQHPSLQASQLSGLHFDFALFGLPVFVIMHMIAKKKSTISCIQTTKIIP
jgi:hypothetical protein